MTDFIVKKLRYDLTSNTGLALVEQYMKRLGISNLADRKFPVGVGGIANSDVLKSYLGSLVQGKNYCDAIEEFRGDDIFTRALDVGVVSSSSTLRQRMGTHAASWFELTGEFNQALLSAKYAAGPLDFGALPCVYMAVDWDTFDLKRILPMSAKLTGLPLLFRADSGLCSLKIMQEVNAQALALSREIAFIIKWNPRKTPVEAIVAERVADTNTIWCHLREGKRRCMWTQELKLEGVGTVANPPRRILRLIERTIDKHGNALLLPDYELEGWPTTLPKKFTIQDIIDLYKDHVTHQQFHSEFKTDMDLERLPRGKFDTNFLVCALAAVAMNILRLIGQNALIGKDAPVRHAAKRRRMKTVMQEIIFKAGRMIKHAGRWALGLGANDSAYIVFERLYRQLVFERQTSTA
jgi:hypothetical protein